jgi:ribonuclease G
MSKELIVSTTAHETKVAILDGDDVVEVFFEREKQYGLAGSIYKGRVTRVLPGMQSAFVNIGLERDAFLYVSDFFEDNEEYDRIVSKAEEKVLKLEEKAPAAAPESAAEAPAPVATGEEEEPAPELPPRYLDPPPDRWAARPGRGRRGRGRRGGRMSHGHGFPESKFVHRTEAPAPSPEPADLASFEILPGESLAKYSRPAEEPAAEEVSLEEFRLDNLIEHSIPEEEPETPHRDREGADPEVALEAEAPAPEPEPEAEPQPASLQASVREPSYGRRFLQRNHRPRRGRGRGRDRDRDRDRRTTNGEELPAPPRVEANITDLLKPGQEILVQIAKEPIGKKGARITSHIALPGRYLVYMPTVDHVGVSRKIQSEQERARLKRVVQEHRTGMPGGFIVRTAGEGHTDDEIRADMDFLYNLWLDLRATAERRPAPALIHHDLQLVERILRDQVTGTFKTIWVDAQEDYERILGFVERFQPQLVGRVKLYTRSTPIFEEFGISQELEKALRPKVWLKSGGYIVINQTEALVAIDVNTGKYVGKSNRLEDTIVKTNLDAVKEIVRQIRLRDLGGIIVVDFIDMDERKNRQRVMQALDEALGEDRAPSKILQFNDFGLVAITRKRVKQSLERTLCAPCPYCDAAGYVKSVETMVLEILTEAKKIAPNLEPGNVTLRVNPEVARVLKSRDNSYLEELEGILRRPVLVKGDAQLHQEKFDFN